MAGKCLSCLGPKGLIDLQGSAYLQDNSLGNWYSRMHLKTPLGTLVNLLFYLSLIKARMFLNHYLVVFSTWFMRMESGVTVLAVTMVVVVESTI